jgi:SAM-dependent methyltransferase
VARSFLYLVLVPALKLINRAARRAVGTLHLLQYKVEGLLRPDAEWFDHQLDVYWQWPARRRASFLERGVLSGLTIRPGATVLELCSGDGFNCARFYASRAASVIGLDANGDAVAHARRVNAAPNVSYVQGDIRADLPSGPFDNVIWDAALTHFSDEEVERVLGGVRRVLRPGGVLSGHTDYEAGIDYSYAVTQLPDSESLADVLGRVFEHVYIRRSEDGPRVNYYFFCSDRADALAFSPQHPDVLVRPANEGRETV